MFFQGLNLWGTPSTFSQSSVRGLGGCTFARIFCRTCSSLVPFCSAGGPVPVPFGGRTRRTWARGTWSSLMFSTTSITGIPTFLQKLISLRTSDRDTPCTHAYAKGGGNGVYKRLECCAKLELAHVLYDTNHGDPHFLAELDLLAHVRQGHSLHPRICKGGNGVYKRLECCAKLELGQVLTTPITAIPTFLQKLISLRTSERALPCTRACAKGGGNGGYKVLECCAKFCREPPSFLTLSSNLCICLSINISFLI